MKLLIAPLFALVLVKGGPPAMMDQNPEPPLPPRPRMSARPTPRYPPSYEVHITTTTMAANSTSGYEGPDWWDQRGFDLKALIAMVYGFDVHRVDFSGALSSERFDVALVLPHEESTEEINARVQEALKQHFKLSIMPESRTMEVYVMTAPNGAGPELRKEDSLGGFSSSASAIWESSSASAPTEEEMERFLNEKKKTTGVSLTAVSMSSGSIGEFCMTLEEGLDRPVVDETGLTGHYAIQIDEFHNKEELFKILHERFGLVLTPGVRNVSMLAVRPE